MKFAYKARITAAQRHAYRAKSAVAHVFFITFLMGGISKLLKTGDAISPIHASVTDYD